MQQKCGKGDREALKEDRDTLNADAKWHKKLLKGDGKAFSQGPFSKFLTW